MPLFDLECQACQHRWEDMIRGGGAIPPCPQCAATDVAKIPSIGHMKRPDFVPIPGTTVEFNAGPRTSKGTKVDGLIIKKKEDSSR